VTVCWLLADNVTTAWKIPVLNSPTQNISLPVQEYMNHLETVKLVNLWFMLNVSVLLNGTVHVHSFSINCNLAQAHNNAKVFFDSKSTWQNGLPKLKPNYYYYNYWDNYRTYTFCEHCLFSLYFITAFLVFLEKHNHWRRQLDLSASLVSAYAVYPADCKKYSQELYNLKFELY
jgi:hypothetical protein